MTISDELMRKTIDDYFRIFKVTPPIIYGSAQETLYSAMIEAIALNRPIPENFNWYPGMPKGAVA